jgi:hypothetical protein
VLPLHESATEPLQAATESVDDPAAATESVDDPPATLTETFCLCVWI